MPCASHTSNREIQVPADTQHLARLGQRTQRKRRMMQAEIDRHGVEATVVERQRFRIGLARRQRRMEFARRADHGTREIDADNAAAGRSDGQSRAAASAATGVAVAASSIVSARPIQSFKSGLLMRVLALSVGGYFRGGDHAFPAYHFLLHQGAKLLRRAGFGFGALVLDLPLSCVAFAARSSDASSMPPCVDGFSRHRDCATISI